MRYILLAIFINLAFPQSLLDRLIVPIYIDSELSFGYDNNYLKLSSPEQIDDMEYRLGDSKDMSSNIIKNRINILYIPYITPGHETKVNLIASTSKYSSSSLKSYNNYSLKVSQHLAPYTWVKFSYSYTPSFYIKSYSQSDPHIVYEFNSNSYMPSSFKSEKIGFELSIPISYSDKIYFSTRYLFESQYYNSDFTEFDLEITNYYFKIRKKTTKNINMSIAYMRSAAKNISYMNGLLSTIDKDRSYIQDKIYIGFRPIME